MLILHPLEPIYDSHSKILILGTMPSPKSRELGFYYGHPRNRFWPVLSDILGEPYPQSSKEKTAFCHRNKIAIWDVLKSCEIQGADDSSIKSPVPNCIELILSSASIKAIFTTGTKAYTLYQKYCFPATAIPAIKLPSTSPANCKTSYEQLKEAYGTILCYLEPHQH